MNSAVIDMSSDVNYNLDYLIILPVKDRYLVDAFLYTFGNVVIFENSVDGVESLTNFLRKNIVGKLIFVDYYAEYDEIINTLVEEHEIEFLFTKYLGELSNIFLLQEFNVICDKYDNKMIDGIAFLDYNLYKVVHRKRRNTRFIMLDIEKNSASNREYKNSIGLLNSDCSNYDSFYNELSSMVFLPEYKVKLLNPTDTTRRFLDTYGIKAKVERAYEGLIGGNKCNMYVNFTGTSAVVFMRSMDLGVPCIVGNNCFLDDNYPLMNKYLVVKSDDNVDEIAEKVREAVDKKRDIMKEYEKFRSEYSKEASTLAGELVFLDNTEWRDEQEFEKLLTVVVPVYNTKKYLAGCLDSIIKAAIPNMEILVINDGSTDASEKVAKAYVKKYPDLVRYIRQDNHGLGNVRNVGLKEAKGKYIASVDSDDTIQEGFFKDALPYLENDVDVVICDWMSISNKESFETAALDWVFKNNKELEGLFYTTIMPSTCNKIIKKDIFTKNKVCYLEQKYEDLSANPLVLLKARTVKYLRKPYYNYYLRENSLMRSKINPREMTDVLAYVDECLNKMKINIDRDYFKFYTYSWRIEEYILNPLYDYDGEVNEEIKYIKKKLGNVIEDIFRNPHYEKMLGKLHSKEMIDFVRRRNQAFADGKLSDFIEENENNIYKLTPGIIYYGD